MKIAILGATGMLGATVLDVFAGQGGHELLATVRPTRFSALAVSSLFGVRWIELNAETESQESFKEKLKGVQWIVNCIGVIKPYIHDDRFDEVRRAIAVNAGFPHRLALAAERIGAQVLQIATDCVYSGAVGAYTESAAHDALDVYGKTKSLGEAHSPAMHHLRCSIIGPEPEAHVSLLDWFLGLARGAAVNGFTNHQWNGVTTYHYARICYGIISAGLDIGHLHHAVPADRLDKYSMLLAFRQDYDRGDLTINPMKAKVAIDRTLATENGERNREIWRAAGYETPPTVRQMIKEMSEHTPFFLK